MKGRRFELGLAAGSGGLLALATSGGIVGERATAGAPGVALAVNALVTVIAIVVLAATWRLTGRLGASSLAAQAVGASVGIALVHVVVRQRVQLELPWLSERPLQLVNDVIATGATLILIRACQRGLDARVFAASLVLVTVYRVTGLHWHLDQAPQGFRMTVQQLVVTQFAATAIGLLIFTHLTRRSALE